MKKQAFYGVAITSLVSALALPAIALAATTTKPVVVTPNTLQGWTQYQQDGKLAFVKDAQSPLPNGALQFDTPDDNGEPQLDRNVTPTTVKNIANLSYSAKRLSGPTYASPAYIIGFNTGTGANTDTTDDFYAWYEPVYNQPTTTDYDQWQTFQLNASSTKFWSFQTLDNKGHGGANGANFFTLNDVQKAYPKAKANELTLNVGSGTAGWSVRADNVTFNTTTWDFEQANPPTTKSDCKNGGYANFTNANDKPFKNQADCVTYVNNHNGGSSTTTTSTSTTTITNNNNVNITNSNSQSASTGNASSSDNTNSSSAVSGASSNDSSTSTPVTLSNNPTF